MKKLILFMGLFYPNKTLCMFPSYVSLEMQCSNLMNSIKKLMPKMFRYDTSLEDEINITDQINEKIGNLMITSRKPLNKSSDKISQKAGKFFQYRLKLLKLQLSELCYKVKFLKLLKLEVSQLHDKVKLFESQEEEKIELKKKIVDLSKEINQMSKTLPIFPDFYNKEKEINNFIEKSFFNFNVNTSYIIQQKIIEINSQCQCVHY